MALYPISPPRSGYTLPVFAAAAAVAALQHLRQGHSSLDTVTLNLVEPAETVEIPIESVARLKPNAALAINRSDPGDNLDLTRNTPIWAMVELETIDPASGENFASPITLRGGEGVGKHETSGAAAIYAYAQRLLQANLTPLLGVDEHLTVTIILPQGRQLATRTSNAAFGVVEGLSLLGTTGISQPLSAPGQLDLYLEELQKKAANFESLVFCIGENGLDLAQKLGIASERLVKTANWLGPMLVAASLAGVQSILLFGYHGKLMKLAGGIFHTHHHLADGRLEILTAHCANLGLQTPHLQAIFRCATAEEGLLYLQNLEAENLKAENLETENIQTENIQTENIQTENIQTNTHWVAPVYRAIAAQIDQRTQAYIHAHTEKIITVGSILFDRQRKIIVKSEAGDTLLAQIC